MRWLFLIFLAGCSGTDFKGIDEAGADGRTEGGTTEGGATGAEAGRDGASCEGTHPIVDAGARYCSSGNCYCAPTDKCLPAANAQACCNDTVKCAN